MGFSSEICRKALEIKKNESKSRAKAYERNLEAVYDAVPELKDIEAQQKNLGSQIIASAMSGNTNALESLKALASELDERKQRILNDAEIKPLEFVCPTCKDTGYDGTKLCSCVLKIAKELTISELSAEVPLNNCNFENFNLKYYPTATDNNGVVPSLRMSAILEYCKKYADSFSSNQESLLFLGNAGLGKTHLSLAIAESVIEQGYGVVYNTAQNLFLKLEDEYFSHRGNNYMDAVLESDLLIIDDLGTEFSSQFTSACLYNIINTRILRGKATLINTNLSLKEIEERYTARISSRFIGNYTMKKFVGMDVRQLKLTEKNK